MARKFNKKTWMINALRRASLRYPPATKALKRTKEEYYIPSKTGKPMRRVKWTCEQCGKKDLKNGEKQLDHTIPLCDERGFVDWNTYIDRYLCDEDNMKTLCIECHSKKTAKEQAARAAYKAAHPESEDEHVPNFRKKATKKNK